MMIEKPTTIFGEIRALVRQGELGPALDMLVNVARGASDELGVEIVSISIAQSAQFNRLRLTIVGGTEDTDWIEGKIQKLTKNILGFTDILEDRMKGVPTPIVGPSLPPSPDDSRRPVPPDPREVEMMGNPLRHIAWIREGLRFASAICKIMTRDKVGTGFLTSNGFIVTNEHVLGSDKEAERTIAIFNYETDYRGAPLTPTVFNLDPGCFFADKELDCAVAKLKTELSDRAPLGAVELSRNTDLAEGQGVSIIQHPGGDYKQIALSGNVASEVSDSRIFYTTSTMKGSSGAPVFDTGWKVVALHQGGGTWSAEHQKYLNNTGILFSKILAHPKIGPLLIGDEA